MPNVCPRPCSGLAIAAVFLSVGVVQFVVGIILLRSKYVFLLAGPDFWTSFCNIAVGCLLGISASVWKESKKRPSTEHFMRRNLLLALQFSALVINVTTVTILLLGEGNTLLSIRLEGSGVLSTSYFINEVLAYAYATSICSPIICIVVSIVAMSGSIFQSYPTKDYKEIRTPETIFKKSGTQSFQWVYSPEMLALAKKKIREAILTASDSSCDETTHDGTPPVLKKYGRSFEDLERVLHKMSQNKRDRVLSDDTVTLQQMDQRRKHKYSPQIHEQSYMEQNTSRSKKSALSERNYRMNLTNDDKSSYLKSMNGHRNSLKGNRNSSHASSSGFVALEQKRQGSEKPDPPIRSPYVDEVFDVKYNRSSEQHNPRNFAAQYRNYQRNRQESENVALNGGLENREVASKNIAAVHKSPRIMYVVNNPDDLLLELKRQCSVYNENRKAVADKGSFSSEACNYKISGSLSTNDSFLPEGSDIPHSFDFVRTSSWAGEFVPISVSNSTGTRISPKLIPVPIPVVPINQEMKEKRFSEDSPGLAIADDSGDIDGKGKGKLASFQENGGKCKNDDYLEYPKPGSQCLKIVDLIKLPTMAPISEEQKSTEASSAEVGSDDVVLNNKSSSSSGYASLSNKKNLMQVYSESPKKLYLDRSSLHIGRKKTPRSKTSASCKTIKRMWSSVGSEKEVDILDQIVDVDSLIGLSEEELIARQTRTRSIRQAVQQRIKGKQIAA